MHNDHRPLKECKEKWKNICAVFRRHLSSKPPSGSGAQPKKDYYLSDVLRFLVPIIKEGKQQHKNSNEEFHRQSHVTTCQNQDEVFENLKQLLQEEKLRRQRAESLLDEAQVKLDSLEESYRLSKGESEVRLGQLSTRVCNLAQTVHREQERVQRLQDSRCRLVQYLHVLSCSLSKEHRKNRIMANQATRSLYRQPSPGAEEADRLRARIKHLRHVLRTSENHRVQRLKMVVVKLRSLCHSVERRYQGMLYLLGRQVQSIAESMCGTSHSSIQPLLPSLSPTQMAQWFLQVQSLAEWIQDHVTSLPALSSSMRQHDHAKMEQSEVSGEALVTQAVVLCTANQ
uniref:Uncharacterized protein n=1 Tax=Timema shepardi TaxID=629360 RepID=A0A7R9G502_TIMSH|nr:unnamed protein product [Timema shepardi]